MNHEAISVLHFSNATACGGAEEHMLTLLRGFDRSLFRAAVVCDPEIQEALRADLPPEVEVVPLSLRTPSAFGAGARLARILRKRRVAVLHSHLFYASVFASPVGWCCRVPAIVETPHVRESWRHGWLKSKYAVDRMAGRFVDWYVAVSEANRRYLIKEKGLPARKIVVIHNGCDLQRFQPAARPNVDLRKSLGFSGDSRVLLVVGRLEPQKGHQVLLQAFPQVRDAFPDARLVCVGDGSLRAELEDLARGLGLSGSVHFAGHRTNLPDWYALAEFTILPSFYEGLPLVAIESLAAGRTVVASAVDGTPEVVVDGRTGLTVPPRDARRLAEAICRLLADAELRRTLAISGRAWVHERFGQEQQIRKTEELYLRALGPRLGAATRSTPAEQKALSTVGRT